MTISEVAEKVGGLFRKPKKLTDLEIEQQKEYWEKEKKRLEKLKEMKKLESEVAKQQADLAQIDGEIAKSKQKADLSKPRQGTGHYIFGKEI